MKTIIVYLRVSTRQQQRSGLGLDAQRQMAVQYAKSIGAVILAEYIEAESGKNCNRPEIAKAIAHCKSSNSVLFIACLDRLARNVHFISGLMESGVEFVCGDMPMATRFTIHILAAVAEEEGRRISERTRKALEQAKKRGVKLGGARGKWNPNLGQAREKSAKVRSELAKDYYTFILPIIQSLKDSGLSLEKIADQLNNEGHRTRRSNSYNKATVYKLLRKYRN